MTALDDILWPLVQRDRRLIQTPDGTVIPFAVIKVGASIVTVIVATRLTFGLSIWLIIPVGLWTVGLVASEISTATFRHAITRAQQTANTNDNPEEETT